MIRVTCPSSPHWQGCSDLSFDPALPFRAGVSNATLSPTTSHTRNGFDNDARVGSGGWLEGSSGGRSGAGLFEELLGSGADAEAHAHHVRPEDEGKGGALELLLDRGGGLCEAVESNCSVVQHHLVQSRPL
mmetsp:Transcript_52367/g.122861  ORF Transcript_52367/g.122861 Transcript_52367/m.122861 type:complete len:131 (-) Transcript_52367:726-1118(-)